MRTDDDTWDITSSVGITALGVAAGRANESARTDRLFDDPFAERFVHAGAAGTPIPVEPAERTGGVWDQMNDTMAVRTRFFDEFFARAARDGVEQAVILASGLDTRPYRTAMPARTFEVDQPAVLEFKNRVLADAAATPRTQHACVGIDLREDWQSALTGAGFAPRKRTAWLAEGLLPYLPLTAQRDLFAAIDALSCPGSRISVEHFGASIRHFADHPAARELERYGFSLAELVFDDEPVDAVGWFAAHGWSVRNVPAAERAREYGRPFHEDVADIAGSWNYVTATKD